MRKVYLLFLSAAILCLLVGCSHTPEVTEKNGDTRQEDSIEPTTVVIAERDSTFWHDDDGLKERVGFSGNYREQSSMRTDTDGVVFFSDAMTDTWACVLYAKGSAGWDYVDYYATTWEAFSKTALLRWLDAEHPDVPPSLVETAYESQTERPNPDEVPAWILTPAQDSSEMAAVRDAVRVYAGDGDLEMDIPLLLLQGEAAMAYVVPDASADDMGFGNKWVGLRLESAGWEVVDATVPRSDWTPEELSAEWSFASPELVHEFLLKANAPQAEPATVETDETAHTPEKGSAERTALMDACRKYLDYDGLFVIGQLTVKGDHAYAEVTPESGGEGVTCYISQSSGAWAVRYSVWSDGGVQDHNRDYLGEYSAGAVPDAVWTDMESWIQ